MPRQLPADCLNEIFECLDDDKVALHSCLLVNRFWCKISVPTLWTSIQNYKTWIACLPNESKEILYKNDILLSSSTSKPPLFNYVAFIKDLSISEIVTNLSKICKPTTLQIRDDKFTVFAQEIFKMFMNQTSLKKLNVPYSDYIPFITY